MACCRYSDNVDIYCCLIKYKVLATRRGLNIRTRTNEKSFVFQSIQNAVSLNHTNPLFYRTFLITCVSFFSALILGRHMTHSLVDNLRETTERRICTFSFLQRPSHWQMSRGTKLQEWILESGIELLTRYDTTSTLMTMRIEGNHKRNIWEKKRTKEITAATGKRVMNAHTQTNRHIHKHINTATYILSPAHANKQVCVSFLRAFKCSWLYIEIYLRAYISDNICQF